MTADSYLQQGQLYVFRTKPDGTNFTLFKYFSPSKLADFIRCKISLTPPKYLNDPFEFAVTREAPDQRELEQLFDLSVEQGYEASPAEYKAAVSFAAFKESKDKIRASWISRVTSDSFRDAEPQEMQEHLSQLFGVVCLTELPDNLLMWSHYTEPYRGFVAEFVCDREHTTYVPRARGTPFGPGFKVMYETELPVFRRGFSNAAQCLCTKSQHWSYEQEWRVIRLLATADFTEETTGYRFLRFSPASLQRVICGHRMAEENKKQVLAMIRNDKLSNLRIQTAYPNKSKQTVEFRELS
jgi:hypothetical protein